MNKKSEISFESRDNFIDIGEHIAYYRRKSGYTQTELGNRIGIKQPYLSKIERQSSITSFSMKTFFNICNELGVDPVKMFEPLP